MALDRSLPARSVRETHKLDSEKYTIAWIAPLLIEAEAAIGVLDRQHEGQFKATRGDDYDYIGGEINGHNVVIATLPAGQNYGVGAAAALANQVKIRFPNIWFALLVGVAAGLPNLLPTESTKYRDIRLGDVLVCIPADAGTGIVPYTLGRDIDGELEINGRQAETPTRVRAAINRIRLKYKTPYRKGHYLATYLQAFQDDMYQQDDHRFVCPSPDEDQLFQDPVDSDEGPEIIRRQPRKDDERTRIWYGSIGSGDILMRNSHRRDELRDRYDLIGLEMEAAGVMNTLPTGVIRGVCDYGDRYKNKKWQPYAAAVAAVYAKAILYNISPAPTEFPVIGSTARKDDLEEIDNAFSQMTDRRLGLQKAYEGTCRWIFDLPEFQSWIKEPRGLLWIKGKPGSGKSTIMNYLYSTICQEYDRGTALHVEFFFNANGTQLQHSMLGMLRSLTNQLILGSLSARAAVRIYYEDKCKSFGKQGRSWHWQEEELKSLLKQALLCTATTQDVIVFVDALDEAGELVACMIAEYFHDLAGNATKTFATLKICISCRHYPLVSIYHGMEVVVERHNYNDIGTFINLRLAATSLSPVDQDQLAVNLIQRADGIFQWIRLIVPIIEKYIRDGSSLEIVAQKLDALPDGISDLYSDILVNVISHETIRQSLQLFQWTCFALTPLTLKELRHALTLVDAEAQTSGLPGSRYCNSKSFVQTDDLMQSQVKSLSGGLIETANGMVQVIHQTVREHFMLHGITIFTTAQARPYRSAVRQQSSLSITPLSNVLIQQSYGRLYWQCLQYIVTEMPVLSSVLSKYEPLYEEDGESYLAKKEQRSCELSSTSPLITHAITNWCLYAEKARDHRTSSITEQVESIESIVAFWVNMYGILLTRYHDLTPRVCTTALHVAARANMIDIAAYKIQNGADVDTKDEKDCTALHVAAMHGHKEITELLCDAGANLNNTTVAGATPMAVAAANGHLELVKYLLARSSDSKDYMTTKDNALIEACKEGHKQIARMLLASGANVNAQGLPGPVVSPLQAAALGGHVETVQLLLENGADVDLQGGHWGCALQAALAYEAITVAKLLLEHGADVNLRSGSFGSALQAASSEMNAETVQLLLDKGANVNFRGGRHGSALAAASYKGDIEIMQLLLDNGADIDLVGESYGHHNSPLSDGDDLWTRDHSALGEASMARNLEVIQFLLERGANVNLKLKPVGSALHMASFEGYRDIVQLLIKMGADVNLRYGEFGGAMHAALQNGQLDIADLLIKEGADINLQGGRYGGCLQVLSNSFKGEAGLVRTWIEMGADVNLQGGEYGNALQAASKQGHLEVVQTLLEFGADVNRRGGKYGTALQAAAGRGYLEIVQTLLEFGADANLPGGRYGSALQLASQHGHHEIVQLLLSKGAQQQDADEGDGDDVYGFCECADVEG